MSIRNQAVVLTAAALLATSIGACGDDPVEPPPTPQPPGAPTGVSMLVSGRSITISWGAGADATSYRVTLASPGEVTRTENTTETAVTFDDLTAGATYTGQVFSINSEGEAASAAATASIPEDPPAFQAVVDDILEDAHWSADKVWILTRPIFVGRDCGADGDKDGCVHATLTIDPGTTVVGRTDLSQGVRGAYLVVSRGSKLIADATGENRRPTADEVIVFTSDKPRGDRDRGDWGGLVINGMARTNAGDEAEGEGDSGFFGGNDDEDDSGILRGVRIEYAGDDVTPSDQLNGLALQGVGSGTTISYVQIHYNVDDGIEPFGGAVSVDHLVVTGIGDDSVDGTDGYRGFMQFIIGQQRGDKADNGMELSNSGSENPNASPLSTAVIANATMIGADEDFQTGEIGGPNGDRGVQFREASRYRVYNSIFRDFGDAGFCVEGGPAVLAANSRVSGVADPSQTISLEGSVVWNNAGAADSDENFEGCDGYTTAQNKAFFTTDGFNNLVADPMLRDGYNDIGTMASPPDIVASAVPSGYAAFDLSTVEFDGINLFAPADGRTLVATDYPGAVAPGTTLADAWYYGWTIWSIDGSDSRANHTGN